MMISAKIAITHQNHSSFDKKLLSGLVFTLLAWNFPLADDTHGNDCWKIP